jgi:microsomal dipeptidase-like Zn-dependent dipeptidase
MAAIYPSTRNTTDARLRAISAHDGIVGVLSRPSFWEASTLESCRSPLCMRFGSLERITLLSG